MRKHLERAAEQTGKKPAQLEGPDLPEGAEHLWAWFWALEQSRTNNGYGPDPIAYSEILAWSELNGLRISSFELACLRDLDAAYLRHAAQEMAKAMKRRAR